MIFPITFLINANGLFDFDLTFPTEAFLFIILALVVTFVFLVPISKQIDARSEFINFNLRKSNILVNFGYEQISQSVGLLTEEVEELNRQISLVKKYTYSNFEKEIFFAENESLSILSKLKGDLAIKAAFIFSNLTNDLGSITNLFFTKRFKS